MVEPKKEKQNKLKKRKEKRMRSTWKRQKPKKDK